MKTIIHILTALLLLVSLTMKAESREVPFTLDDRDRIMRTEQEIKSLRNETNVKFDAVDKRFDAVDKRFEAVNQRFDQLFNFLWAIIGIFTTMTVAVFGFAFWDRKLSL